MCRQLVAWWCTHSPLHLMLKEHADNEEDGSSDGQGSSYFSGEVIDRGNSLRSHVWRSLHRKCLHYDLPCKNM